VVIIGRVTVRDRFGTLDAVTIIAGIGGAH
jgi:hypothetical protein